MDSCHLVELLPLASHCPDSSWDSRRAWHSFRQTSSTGMAPRIVKPNLHGHNARNHLAASSATQGLSKPASPSSRDTFLLRLSTYPSRKIGPDGASWQPSRQEGPTHTAVISSVSIYRQTPWVLIFESWWKKVNVVFVLRACLCCYVCPAVAGAALSVVGALWLAKLLLSRSC